MIILSHVVNRKPRRIGCSGGAAEVWKGARGCGVDDVEQPLDIQRMNNKGKVFELFSIYISKLLTLTFSINPDMPIRLESN